MSEPVPVYVKEIPILRFKDDSGKHEFFNSIVPHMVPEFNKHDGNVIGCNVFPPFNRSEQNEQVLAQYFKDNFREGTRILFDNVFEGNTLVCIEPIYEFIRKYNIPPSACYFFTGGLQVKKLHEKYCDDMQITDRINVRVLMVWEKHVAKHALALNIPEPNYVIGKKEKTFLCFNRMCRKHRVALLGILYEKDLVKNSYTSFYPKGAWADLRRELSVLPQYLRKETYTTVTDNILHNLHNFPLTLNLDSVDDNANYVKATDSMYYDNSYFSVVTETFFFAPPNGELSVSDEPSILFGEKIFKPIFCKHPFIMLNRPFSLEYLKKLGYKTFHPFIDETYDTIIDDEQRLIAIVNEIERLSKKTQDEWTQWQIDVASIIHHNYKILINKKIFDYVFEDE